MASPHRRLSQRRGSSAAPDPFLLHHQPHQTQHPEYENTSGTSRITIVRIPNPNAPAQTPANPPSPGIHAREFSVGGSTNLARRSSWGSNKSGGSDGASGGGGARGRMSFAFATFTPINPPGGRTGGPPQPISTDDRSGPATPTSSGPPSPASFRKSRTYSGGSMGGGPAIPRATPLTPQQLYEAAQQATNPSAIPTSATKYGYGGHTIPAGPNQAQSAGPQPSAFVPLPSEVYLPFVDRPYEVSQLLQSTTPTGRLFALLASTFPQEHPASSISRPNSAMSVRTAGGTSHQSKSVQDIPEDPKAWTFSQLNFYLRHVTRQEAPDREWIARLRTCINSRSEVLWQRFSAALGVPPGFEEELEEESAVVDEEEYGLEDDGEGRTVRVGGTSHAVTLGKTKLAAGQEEEQQQDSPLGDDGDEGQTGEDIDDDWDPAESSLPGSEAIIEPITASSLPPPPSASGLSAPTQGLGLTPTGDGTHELENVAEEEEPEQESESPKPEDAPVSTSPANSYLGPGGTKVYAPRAHSPLASTSSTDDATKPGKPALNITTPSMDSTTLPSAQEEGPPEIDFTEPDPNAEPIQGIRIMNAPMLLTPRLIDGAELVASPGNFTPGQSPTVTHAATELLAGMRPRTGSNSSLYRSGSFGAARFKRHERTQSFGAFGVHSRSGSTGMTPPPTTGVLPHHGPHFPGSFAGVGVPIGNPMRNPRMGSAARPAGISLGGGMHYTPKAGRVGVGSSGLSVAGNKMASTSAVSLTETDAPA